MYLKMRLAAVMKEKNVTEAQLAERADVARNTVRSLSRNANRRVDFEVVEKLAAALGVRPMDLFEETEKEPGNWTPAPLAHLAV